MKLAASKVHCANSANLLLLLVFVFGSTAALAQLITGSISGTVRDISGGVLSGATVTVTNMETGQARTTRSSDAGRYTIPNLNLGRYQVSGNMAGFQTVIRNGIELTVGREAIVDMKLPVGQVAEQVTVTGEAPLVETTSSTLTSLVDDQKIRDLPLNGRGFTDLAFLQPGVLFAREGGTGSNVGFTRKATVNGTRPEQSRFLMDGQDIEDVFQKTPGGVSGVQLGVDAVKEFEVRTNSFSAEFGHSSGGVVNAVTKAGSNELHGSVFEYLRNDKLDARNFFDAQKSPLRRNQFGGSIGGPIKKDRTFFFFNYEGLRWRKGLATSAVVPDANARLGILPGRPQFTVAPAVVPYLNVYPLSNGRSFNDGTGEFISSGSIPTNENYYVGRIDYTLSASDSLSGRYAFDSSQQSSPQPIPIYNNLFTARSQFVNLAETRIFSPTVVNAARFSFSRTNPFVGNLLNGDLDPSLQWIPGKIFGTLSITGMAGYGTGATSPQRLTSNLFEYADSLTVIRGNHTMKLGAQIKRIQLNTFVSNRQGGNYTFNSLLDFLQNRPFNFLYQSLDSIPVRGMRQYMAGFFVQDEYRVTPRLTWNYGLRYEFVTVPREVNGRIANMRTPLDKTLTLGAPYFKNPSLKNFSPRLGIAWDPFGNGKTSIRTGFGLFYDQIWVQAYYSPATLDGPPLFTQLQLDQSQGVVFPYGANHPAPSGNFPPTVQAMPFQFPNPYVIQYNFTVQRELPSSIVLSVGYVGSHGVKIGRVVEGDTAYPVIQPDGQQYFPPGSVRRNPTFADVRERGFDGMSFYNSFQLGATKRFSNGLQFQASYTYSRNVSDSDGTQGSLDNTNARDLTLIPEDHMSSRGLSSLDIRHNFIFNSTYELPWAKSAAGFTGAAFGGWSINGILSLSTGMPVSMMAGYNVSNNQTNNLTLADVPSLAPGKSNNPVLGGPDKYFDPTAFVLPLPGFYGNLARNTVIGPGFGTLDFSLVKAFKITERTHLQFRSEFFNFLNRANFAHPNNTLFTATRGRVGSAGRITRTVVDNRQIQIALRLTF